MCFVSIFENRRIKPIQIVLRRGEGGKRENDGGGKSNIYIVSTYVNITVYPLYNNYMLIK
jgi:hypothetical protein